MRRVALVAGLCLLGAACGAPEAPPPRPNRTLKLLDRISADVAGLPPGARWHTLGTPSFRVLYLEDAGLAARLARAAEATRRAQLAWWYDLAERPAWSPRCELYLFPSKRLLVQWNGGDAARAGAAASRRSRLVRGQTLQRLVHLAADEPRLLEELLPHEVSHIIVGELVGARDAPRWADEGLVVLAMSPASHEGYRALLARFHARGQLFGLRELTAMEVYPDPPYRQLYYAQSLSLVQFLLGQGDRSRLLRLLRSALPLERALRVVYGIEGLAGLESRWRSWL